MVLHKPQGQKHPGDSARWEQMDERKWTETHPSTRLPTGKLKKQHDKFSFLLILFYRDDDQHPWPAMVRRCVSSKQHGLYKNFQKSQKLVVIGKRSRTLHLTLPPVPTVISVPPPPQEIWILSPGRGNTRGHCTLYTKMMWATLRAREVHIHKVRIESTQNFLTWFPEWGQWIYLYLPWKT